MDSEDIRRFWNSGPPWLAEKNIPKSRQIGKTIFAKAILEARNREKNIVNSLAVAHVSARADSISLLEPKHFSSWSKPVRTVAYVLRFIETARKRCRKFVSKTIDHIEYFPAVCSPQEYSTFRFFNEVAHKCAKVNKSSKLFLSSPMIDEEDGLIGCQSRLIK